MGKHNLVEPPIEAPAWFPGLASQVGYYTLVALACFGFFTLLLELSGV